MTVEVTNNVKCDICNKKIIQKKMDEGYCSSLIYQKFIPGEEGGYIEKEISDFCSDCYLRIKEFVVSIGGTVPSYFLDTEGSDVLKEEIQDDRLH